MPFKAVGSRTLDVSPPPGGGRASTASPGFRARGSRRPRSSGPCGEPRGLPSRGKRCSGDRRGPGLALWPSATAASSRRGGVARCEGARGPAFLAAPTWPSGAPDPAALRAEEGKAHLCRPHSADSKLLFGVATLGNNLAVASARPQSRAHRGSESPRLLPGAQTAKAAAHQRALACSAGAYPKRKKSPLAAVFESWRAHLQPHR